MVKDYLHIVYKDGSDFLFEIDDKALDLPIYSSPGSTRKLFETQVITNDIILVEIKTIENSKRNYMSMNSDTVVYILYLCRKKNLKISRTA